MNPVLETLLGHRSIRRFTDEPISDDNLTRIVKKEEYNPDLEDLIQEYDKEYADYLLHRPWNNRVGNWSELAADFYRTPFHYPGVAKALTMQGFASVKDCK